jgi:Rieske Fe-S protein
MQSNQEAQVQRLFRRVGGAAAFAILTSFALTGAPQTAAAQEKKVKDQGEYDISNQAFKDINEKNWKQALTDIDTWKQKYPESDWKDDREFYYLQALLSTQQFDKAVQFGSQLMDKDLGSMYKSNQGNIIAIYYMVTASAASLIGHNATPEQIAIGDKAAHKLLDFAGTYFVPANKPAGQTDAQFAETRTQMEPVAKGYLLQEAVQPGLDAMAKKDCPAAEAVYSKALGDYPDNSWIAFSLAGAYNCEQKPFQALFEFARAAAVDPTVKGTRNATQYAAFVKKTYVTLHGSDEGYDQLLQQAKSATLPPADFKIKTKEELDAATAETFAKDHPELAVWKGLKDGLTTQGDAFFQNMKGAELPPLLGIVADAKPACRSKTLTVYVPLPENTAKTPEITIKLETALTGKPEVGSTIKFVGVGDSFAASPFMLTLTAEKDKIQDLKVTPCAVAPVRKKK